MKCRYVVIVALFLDFRSNDPALVKILAGRHQLGAECFHRRVLLPRIAFGDDDHHWNIIARRRKRDRLAVVPARCSNETLEIRLSAAQRIHVDRPATYLKRTDRGMVLVLDDDSRTD